jgi:thioredoxin-related protein
VDSKKKRTLEDLFKPPLDLMFKGDWQAARDAAEASKKYLIVNIQNSIEFSCQMLNRDVWSNEAVKMIIQEHFIFWQVRFQGDLDQKRGNI